MVLLALFSSIYGKILIQLQLYFKIYTNDVSESGEKELDDAQQDQDEVGEAGSDPERAEYLLFSEWLYGTAK
jgi:hypothetical protein